MFFPFWRAIYLVREATVAEQSQHADWLRFLRILSCSWSRRSQSNFRPLIHVDRYKSEAKTSEGFRKILSVPERIQNFLLASERISHQNCHEVILQFLVEY